MTFETPDLNHPSDTAGPPAAAPAELPEVWKIPDLILLILFIPVDLFLSNLLAFMGYRALKPWTGWHATPQALSHNPFFLLSLQTVFYIFLLAYLYLLIAIHYRAPFWETLRWRRISLRQASRFFLGGIILAFLVLFAPALFPESKSFPLEKLFSSAGAAYAICAFAVLVAPVMEELLFRGVAFAFLEKYGGLRIAVVGTALLFAGLHIPEYWGAWNHVLLIFVVGFALSLARGITGSLTPSVILHLAYNATLMAILYLQTNQFRGVPGLFRF
jgi:membrane protease YdiL (CAAX protease family)